jgi:NADH-quinone oxidoreductase subunit G
MADDQVTIEIDGKPLQARKGQMLIQVADEAGIYIPRFCYHKKLSIAANCRMCLVEVEKMPKPAPACATPVMDGMKAFTRSKVAREAQKSVMEFLLINHPLDCPICDQGGECELQDLAMGYGRDISRYTESKRVVADEDIGPLVSTDMTRCIHCTRCVRFGEEIAGLRELGATGRGEDMRIGTYVKKAMVSELSGNVIDVCPVGALNNKPYRFNARAWELMRHAAVSPHDCVGSNIWLHVLRNTVRRAAPRENEIINESWLADRDRYSCHAITAPDRLGQPFIKNAGGWHAVSWDDALREVTARLERVINEHGADMLGALCSSNSTVEEYYLLQKLLRELGSRHIDFRLRQQDFAGDVNSPLAPWLGMDISTLEKLDAALLIGSNIRKEQPLIAHRLRKAALRGAAMMFVNSRRYDFHFPVAGEMVTAPSGIVENLAAIANALVEDTGKPAPSWLQTVSPGVEHRRYAQNLRQATNAAVILGSQATLWPDYSRVLALVCLIAELANCKFGCLSDGANTAGAWLAGAVPHRDPAGVRLAENGLNAREMLEKPRKAYIVFNTEPERDGWNPALAKAALKNAHTVIAISAFDSPDLREYADIILPLAAFSETPGTYINTEGRWQEFQAAVTPFADARPGWKILRVIANGFGLSGFDYFSSGEILNEVQRLCADIQFSNSIDITSAAVIKESGANPASGFIRISDIPIYAGDPLLRRSVPLQQTQDAMLAKSAAMNSETARKNGLALAQTATVTQNGEMATFPLRIDEGIPDNCISIGLGIPGSEKLGAAFGNIEVKGP